MGIKYTLSDLEKRDLKEEDLKSELAPRNSCERYVIGYGGEATLITKEEFDYHARNKDFSEGPIRDSFGNGPEPYNPNRQAFGMLKSRDLVYCELSDEHQGKTIRLIELLNNALN